MQHLHVKPSVIRRYDVSAHMHRTLYISFLHFCDISLSIAIFLKYFSVDKIFRSLTMRFTKALKRLHNIEINP